ncbi:hypothetical protein DBR28_03470 [Chryseobacterium sp. HMWF028]|nr:hypothetical protein DBR28_03470 [Chryseobacterium sp. HMWF028]
MFSFLLFSGSKIAQEMPFCKKIITERHSFATEWELMNGNAKIHDHLSFRVFFKIGVVDFIGKGSSCRIVVLNMSVKIKKTVLAVFFIIFLLKN